MKKVYLKIGTASDETPPGVVIIEASEALKQDFIDHMQATGEAVAEITKEEAREILIIQNLADGMSQTEAEHEAAVDLGEVEE